MRVCFPVIKNEGMTSRIYGHFASAPQFVLVDTETEEISAIQNHDESAPESGCNPFKALSGSQLDGVIVGGIGDNFLELLNMMGFRVYEAQSESVRENVELFARQELTEMKKQFSVDAGRCGGEEGNHQCSHTHDDVEFDAH